MEQAEAVLDARAQRSRTAILEAARAAMLANPAASLSDVARRAGVGRATLYRHFSTREALVRALARQSLLETEAMLSPVAEAGLQGRAAIEAVILGMAPLADQFHFLLSLWEIAEGDTEVTAIYEGQLAQLAQRVKEAQAEGSIDRELPVAWVVSSLDALLYASWWMVREGQCDARQAAEWVNRTLFRGIA